MSKTSIEQDYVTIFAPTPEDAFLEFRRQGLGERGYVIEGRMGRHKVSVVSSEETRELDDLSDLVVATFRRT